MKEKKLKKIANHIADLEYNIQTSKDPKVVAYAQSEMLKLAFSDLSLGDMVVIDELVQNILQKKLKNS